MKMNAVAEWRKEKEVRSELTDFNDILNDGQFGLQRGGLSVAESKEESIPALSEETGMDI